MKSLLRKWKMNGVKLEPEKSESLESLDLRPLKYRNDSLLRKHCCKSKKLTTYEEDGSSQSESESGEIRLSLIHIFNTYFWCFIFKKDILLICHR